MKVSNSNQVEDEEVCLPSYTLARAGKTAFERLQALDLSDFTDSQKNILTALMKMAFSDGKDVGREEILQKLEGIQQTIANLRVDSDDS